MDCDKPSRRYDLKYASYDALNTKKRYSHVQSKVKVYIDNLKKEDQERRQARITRHRSEPSELAEWKSPEENSVKFHESSTDWKLVLAIKDKEFKQLKQKLDEMQIYGDTITQLLSNERTMRMELQKKLNAVRQSRIANSCTWSDPGINPPEITEDVIKIAENDKANVFDDTEDDVFYIRTEWQNNVESDVEIADDNDETILLQSVEVKAVRKGIKYRLKKIFRCCTPCIKPKVA